MSIRQRLIELEATGALTRYAPALRKPLKRRLFLTKEAVDDFAKPDSATNILCGKGFIAGALTKWVSGGLVHGNKRRGLFIDRLDPPPDEVWEMRVTEPAVQARLIGRFAEQDTMILTKFHTRTFLGDKGSANWELAMYTCVERWNELFPGTPPLIGNEIAEYVSENCDVFPI